MILSSVVKIDILLFNLFCFMLKKKSDAEFRSIVGCGYSNTLEYVSRDLYITIQIKVSNLKYW